jgi:hypothetical protein
MASTRLGRSAGEMKYVAWLALTALALLIVHGLLLMADRALHRFRWRYILLTLVMLQVAGGVGLLPAGVVGTPDWTLISTMVVLVGWVAAYCAIGAIRVGKEQRVRRSSLDEPT